VGTILSDLGLEVPLVGTTVTAHVVSSGSDGILCTVYDVSTEQPRDAILPRADAYDLPDGATPPELKEGDTLIALVVGATSAPDAEPGGQERLTLSATAPDLVEQILSAFVDEILSGEVVIKGLARVAGTKTKIAVAPTTPGVDAKGACIGRAANRLKSAENLLNRNFGKEKLEIIEYSSDRMTYLVNAMNPVQVSDVLVRGDNAAAAVEPHLLSGGIGIGGLNAQLAGRLTGLYVRVVKAGTDLEAALDEVEAERAAENA
jgi:transcription antitermination factor NusA-like protein